MREKRVELFEKKVLSNTKPLQDAGYGQDGHTNSKTVDKEVPARFDHIALYHALWADLPRNRQGAQIGRLQLLIAGRFASFLTYQLGELLLHAYTVNKCHLIQGLAVTHGS